MRRTLKMARREFWKSYVSSITVHTPLTEAINRVRKISGKYSAPPPPVLSHDGRTLADPETDADLFAEHFASISRKDPFTPTTRHRRHIENAECQAYVVLGERKLLVPCSVWFLENAVYY